MAADTARAKGMRTGILGGTFNPVHNAHLRIAAEALNMCGLDRVLFLPAADPPHKCLDNGTPFATRLEMVKLAVSGLPRFDVSDIESRRSGKSYTIETLSRLSDEYPDDHLFFIIGSDSFHEIGTWHRYADIFTAVSLIVVERPGAETGDPLNALPVAVRNRFEYDASSGRLLHDSGHEIFFVTGKPLAISSSIARQHAAAGKTLDTLVPPAVATFIKEQGLYRL